MKQGQGPACLYVEVLLSVFSDKMDWSFLFGGSPGTYGLVNYIHVHICFS